MSTLLEESERLLAGDVGVPSEARRGSCWLARAALEDTVRQHLAAAGYPTGAATMRAVLACLESLHHADPDIALTARHAWIGLSHASHHPAYELAPTVAEVRHLIHLVARVILLLGVCQGDGRIDQDV